MIGSLAPCHTASRTCAQHMVVLIKLLPTNTIRNSPGILKVQLATHTHVVVQASESPTVQLQNTGRKHGVVTHCYY